MFVLITGGAGFIGSHTVEALLEKGARVRVLDNLSSGYLSNLPLQHVALEFVKGDVKNQDDVNACIKDITHVLHLAALVSVPLSIEDPMSSHNINIDGYLNILNAARLAGVKRVVHASSAAVYGIPASLPLTETSDTKPLSPYGLEKLVMDQYAALYKELYNVSTMGLRYFNVYGPRQNPDSPYSGVISKFASLASQGQGFNLFGDGLQTRDFISVKDVASANIAALETNMNGVANIATGTSVSLLDITQIFSELVGKQITVEHKPARLGDIPHSSVIPNKMKNELSIKEGIELSVGLKELFKDISSVN